MSTLNEKSAVVTTSTTDESSTINGNVLTITRPSATRPQPSTATDVLSTIEDCDSTRSMTPPQSPHQEKSTIESPSSPYSFLQKSESKQNITGSNSGFDTDIEALAKTKTETGCSKTGLVAIKSKSTSNAWPNLREQKKIMKEKKRNNAFCGCWAALTRTQRNLIRGAILLVLIGLIIGLCVGVTTSVHGGVFHPN